MSESYLKLLKVVWREYTDINIEALTMRFTTSMSSCVLNIVVRDAKRMTELYELQDKIKEEIVKESKAILDIHFEYLPELEACMGTTIIEDWVGQPMSDIIRDFNETFFNKYNTAYHSLERWHEIYKLYRKNN